MIMKYRILLAALLLSAALAPAQVNSENPFYQSQLQAQAANDPGDPPLGEDPLDADPVPLDGWLPWLMAAGAGLAAFGAHRRRNGVIGDR